MLSPAHNERLTRTGPDTPLGQLYRRYWIPALLSEEIASPDSPPARVRLLGEKLVAFRDSQGRIGLIDEHCPHCGTSLFFGRNEQCGLTCIYHGWKIDVGGNIVETPAEPKGSDFKNKLHHRAYPTHEAAGIIYAYLGPEEKIPLFPNYEWIKAPLAKTYATKCWMECNYLQGLEGECDSSHLSFVRRDFSATGRRALLAQDVAPEHEIAETDFGLHLVARRAVGAGEQYVRISSFVMPTRCGITARSRDGHEIHINVPADDTQSWRYDLGFKRVGPVPEDDWHRRKQIGPDYRKLRNLQNDYLIDRQAQKQASYTGIEDFINQDTCGTETMGAIDDRSQEHLGVSDAAVIAVRRYLLNPAPSFQNGGEPPHRVEDPAKNNFPMPVRSPRSFPRHKAGGNISPACAKIAKGRRANPINLLLAVGVSPNGRLGRHWKIDSISVASYDDSWKQFGGARTLAIPKLWRSTIDFSQLRQNARHHRLTAADFARHCAVRLRHAKAH